MTSAVQSACDVLHFLCFTSHIVTRDNNVAVMVTRQLNTVLFDHRGGTDLNDLIGQDLFFEFSALGDGPLGTFSERNRFRRSFGALRA